MNSNPVVRHKEVHQHRSLERLKRERQLAVLPLLGKVTVAVQNRPRAIASAVIILRSLRLLTGWLRGVELVREVAPGQPPHARYEWEKWEERKWG